MLLVFWEFFVGSPTFKKPHIYMLLVLKKKKKKGSSVNSKLYPLYANVLLVSYQFINVCWAVGTSPLFAALTT